MIDTRNDVTQIEESQVLLGGGVAPGGGLAGLGGNAAVLLPLLGGQGADVGLAVADELACEVVHFAEVVGGVVEVGAPVEAEPADVLLDGFRVFDVLADGVRVVHAQVADAAVLQRHAEVEAEGFRVADVQVAVGLGREARDDLAAVAAGADVFRDHLADEMHVLGGGFRLGAGGGGVLVHWVS